DYIFIPNSYEPIARVDFTMTEQDTGDCLRVSKSSPNVALDWTIYSGSGNFVVRRGIIGDFGNYSLIFGPSSLKVCNDAVLEDTTSYWYDIKNKRLTDTLYFYHSDHLGTPIAMMDTSGTLVWRAEHTPFGSIYALTVGTIANNLRFPGQYFDSETGLFQNWFRDYEARIGRYWEVDPFNYNLKARIYCRNGISRLEVLNEQPARAYFKSNDLKRMGLTEVNRFSYSKNNPVRSIDPFGEYTFINFPPGKTADLDASMTRAINGLKACCNCIRCADAANKLREAHIIYDQGLGSICGATWPFIDPNGFHVGPGILPGHHCCAAQTFAEEALHLAGASDSNNEAGQIVATCIPCR
ncbi:MAG: hypothetical protein GYA35_10300, partial [Thermoanaerobaculaceae bacterium]|nr:hypothetical protein [Thermoanaerobaculaceae bacterium]